MAPVSVLICGGGNGAHVLAGLSGARDQVTVRVLSLFADEAQRWSDLLRTADLEVTGRDVSDNPVSHKSKPAIVSNDPALAVPGADVICFIVPAFAHEQYFNAIKDHIKPGTVIVGIPSAAGFEFAARGILGDLAKSCTLMAYESLPWACRIQEFGKHVHVIGFKEKLAGALQLGTSPPLVDPLPTLQKLLGDRPIVETSGHILGITLMGTNSYIHPCVMYGTWQDWDGQPKDESPLFYQGLNDLAAKTLSDVSDEVVSIAKGIMKKRPGVDLNVVRHVYQWYMDCYGSQIKDKSNLQKAMQTNPGYDGLRHPCKKTDAGKFVPDFTYRYITEDIPCGLVVIKGVGEIAEVKTPVIDKVLAWCQTKMGCEYIIGDKLCGKDVSKGQSRAPQRYGLTTLDQILGL